MNTERLIVAPYDEQKIKQPLLLYDRVFAPDWSNFRTAGPFDGDLVNECAWATKDLDEVREYESLFFDNKLASEQARNAVIRQAVGNIMGDVHAYAKPVALRNAFVSAATNSLVQQEKNVTPLYYKDSNWNELVITGECEIAYEAVLNNVIVISESPDLSQIIEFRSDTNSVRKFRDLRLWLEHSLQAKSVEHATEIISQKIEDYEWAIRKHGFDSQLGYFNQIINWKNVTAYSLATTAGSIVHGEVGAALAGGFVVFGQCLAKVVESKTKLIDTKRGNNREVAILYDINKEFEA